jgi:hypothetical protein
MAAGAGLLVVALHSVLEVTLLSELSLPLFALFAATARIIALDEAGEDRAETPPAGEEAASLAAAA